MADKLYKSAKILAPMVRCGTLPLRLLALRYGANTVYSEEIVDKKLIQCERIENKILGTIDFVSGEVGNRELVFRTLRQEEHGKLVFQIGTATPELAVQAAKVVAADVDSIDVNMGCPKHFSVHSGMGVALTRDSDRACSIIRALRASLDIPVSCKIRLLETVDETVSLVQALEAAGAQAIGVHARTASMRPKDKPRWNQLRQIVESVSVPIIVNGDVWGPLEIKELKELSGCSSFMSARGALKNIKVCFENDIEKAKAEQEDNQSIIRIIHDYVRISIDFDNHGKNTKYVIQYMLKMNNQLGSTFGQALSSGKTRTMFDIAKVCGLTGYYDHALAEREKLLSSSSSSSSGGGGGSSSSSSSSKMEDILGTGRVYDDDFFYARPKKRQKMGTAPNVKLPPDFKNILMQWGDLQTNLTRKQQCPQYQHIDVGAASDHFDDVAKKSQAKCFKAAVYVAGKKFIGEWAKSKSQATSKAAHAAIVELGIDNESLKGPVTKGY
jgi:tRNA-dihydrouridine synthase